MFESWSPPVNLGATVNGQFNDFAAAISSDGETLFFTSDRPDGFGLRDVYMTTRTRSDRHH